MTHTNQATDARTPRIHPTAIVETGVEIGAGTSVWDNVHLRGPSHLGHDCIVGEKTYIAYGVKVGNFVKINAQVYICTGVTISDKVMIAAGVIFTNDRYPRAFDDEGVGLATSAPTFATLRTTVEEGATIGAGALIGPGVTIGRYAMVGMGAVLTADVPAHGLVMGNPARQHGYVCVCGLPLPVVNAVDPGGTSIEVCAGCHRAYEAPRWGSGEMRLLMDCPDWRPFTSRRMGAQAV